MSKWTAILKEPRICRDSVLKMFVGKRIGSGYSRHVYALRQDETRVIKIEHTGNTFHNIMEWNVWQEVKDTPIEDWFAPCYDIDPDGNALTQARVLVFENEKVFKKMIEETRGGVIPAFFDDVHYGNFGVYEGRVVCCDYAYNHFLSEAVKYGWRNLVHEDVTVSKTNETKVEVQHELKF